MNNHQYTSTCPLRCYMLLYSLNFSRVKIFTDFAVLSQTVKILTSKYLSKHTFSLRNTLSPQKLYLGIKKSGSTMKLFTLKNLGYMVYCTLRMYVKDLTWSVSELDSILEHFRTADAHHPLLSPPKCGNWLVTIFV